MGIQKHMDMRGRQMEGSIQNQPRIIQTHSNVFRDVQFTSDFSINDGLNLHQGNQGRCHNCVHG